ncbi:MAG: hypothetical protein DCC65_14170 [Planctomycetota bacterium]|nr:MAG: hypothetical protein DCC65_14170 [Planctomycetota bacterium]
MKPRCLSIAMFFCALGFGGVQVHGATITYFDEINATITNWTANVELPKFDPALGVLNKVILEMDAGVKGVARFESLDPQPSTVSTNFAASIRLRRPDLTDLLVAWPKAHLSESISAYDGVLDFGGASGRTHDNLAASEFASTELVGPLAPSDEDLFVGAGEMVTLNVRARGESRGSGAGNLYLLFNTYAAATVYITYDYTPIPEPATIALLGAAGILVRPRRRFARR